MIRRKILRQRPHIALEWIQWLEIVMDFEVQLHVAIIDLPLWQVIDDETVRTCSAETI